jgi:hypothetical protein
MPPDLVEDVKQRDNYECAVCGLPVTGLGHVHHRKPRGMGGSGVVNIMSNLLFLHPSCHLRHVEEQRQRAIENGWLVVGDAHPAEVPLIYKLNDWVYLSDDGHMIICNKP